MIKVYSKPKCVQCKMTKEFLKQNNVEFEEVNVFEDEEALELIKLHGFQRLPVVTRNNSFDFAFSGFQIDLLEELIEK
nr:MAG TPA: glutaredoxin-like protein [Caudoviricetes sp.]